MVVFPMTSWSVVLGYGVYDVMVHGTCRWSGKAEDGPESFPPESFEVRIAERDAADPRSTAIASHYAPAAVANRRSHLVVESQSGKHMLPSQFLSAVPDRTAGMPTKDAVLESLQGPDERQHGFEHQTFQGHGSQKGHDSQSFGRQNLKQEAGAALHDLLKSEARARNTS